MILGSRAGWNQCDVELAAGLVIGRKRDAEEPSFVVVQGGKGTVLYLVTHVEKRRVLQHPFRVDVNVTKYVYQVPVV